MIKQIYWSGISSTEPIIAADNVCGLGFTKCHTHRAHDHHDVEIPMAKRRNW